MRKFVKSIPLVGPISKKLYQALLHTSDSFKDSDSYWKLRYESGGDSGVGSVSELAEFKAEVLNAFVKDENISTIIEYGCGDGNQLKLSKYPSYIGFDISSNCLARCEKAFLDDKSKSFRRMVDYSQEQADLTLSLDVIYHLVEDTVFVDYMERLFDSAKEFVVIYSSDTDRQNDKQAPHIRHRKFSTWIRENRPWWTLHVYIPNRYPLSADGSNGSFADFFIYRKLSNVRSP